jgi:transcriptional regulator with XRE-family HTH domain
LQTSSYANDAIALGRRIKTARTRLGWSLAEVARRSGLSRGYINALELGRSKRPGADALRRLEDVLGPLRPAPEPDTGTVPAGLSALARERQLPESEVRVLASLQVRGRQPQSKERWRFIYDALLASEAIDQASEHDLSRPPE